MTSDLSQLDEIIDVLESWDIKQQKVEEGRRIEEFEDLMARRKLVYVDPQIIMTIFNARLDEFEYLMMPLFEGEDIPENARVIAVYADPLLCKLVFILVSPDWPITVPGAYPPTIDAKVVLHRSSFKPNVKQQGYADRDFARRSGRSHTNVSCPDA